MRPVVHRGRQLDWGPKDFVGEEESLYSKWSRTCWRRQFDPGELYWTLRGAPLSRKILCAEFLDGKNGNMGEYAPVCAMMDLNSIEFYHALGSGIYRQKERVGVTTTFLRYCPRCMAHGYHATLFQHFALTVCPVHDVPLVSRCAKCRRGMEPTWASTAQHPFACSYCGHLLIKTVPDSSRDYEIRLIDLMLREPRRILARPRETSFCVPASAVKQWQANPSDSETRLRRHIHRHFAWPPLDCRDRWTTFKQVELRLEEGLTDVDWLERWDSISRKIGTTLVNLRELCREQEPAIRLLAGMMDSNESGVRLQCTVGVVATAYCKLAYLYGVSPIHYTVDESARPTRYHLATTDRRLVQRGAAFLHSLAGNRALVEYEVLGMFCVILKRVAVSKKLVFVDWRESPSVSEYCPAWCFASDLKPPVLYIRSRANWKLVRRLIDRYSKSMLL